MLKENCQPRIVYPVKTFSRNEGEIKKFSDEGKLRTCHQQTYLKRMGKGSSLSKKKMLKEGILEHQEGRTMEKNKNMSKHNRLSFSS